MIKEHGLFISVLLITGDSLLELRAKTSNRTSNPETLIIKHQPVQQGSENAKKTRKSIIHLFIEDHLFWPFTLSCSCSAHTQSFIYRCCEKGMRRKCMPAGENKFQAMVIVCLFF